LGPNGQTARGQIVERHGWAIVTGASSGLGRLFVEELAEQGYPVLAVARRGDRLEQLASEMATRGGKVEALAADLGTVDGVRTVAARATELRDVELLVNNAGISAWGRFQEIPLDKHLALLHINIEAVVSLTSQLLPQLVQRKRAGIINIASVTGFQPMPFWTTYAASKAFILSFTEGIAYELKDSGVRVLAICPGMMKTELYEASDSRELSERLPALTPDQVVRATIRALRHPRRVVKVVGVPNLLLAFASRVTPRRLMRSIVGRLLMP